jgi:putative restriction endonuclease
MSYDDVLGRLRKLRLNVRDGHVSPHKPVLLLTLLDLAEAGLAGDNHFLIDDALLDTWQRYFDIVRSASDKPTVENPLYHLSGDRVWRLVSDHGHTDLYLQGERSKAPTVEWLKANVRYGQLDYAVWKIVRSPSDLPRLREDLIAHYFPKHGDTLLSLSRENVARLGGSSPLG